MYYYFNVNGMQIAMPKSTGLAPWVNFFTQVMQLVPTAPMYALLAMCNIIYDLPLVSPSGDEGPFCYDTAIMMAAEDETPASEAATKTGFYAQGVSQLIDAAKCHDPFFNIYVTALEIFLSRGNLGINAQDQREARKLIDWCIQHNLKLPINY